MSAPVHDPTLTIPPAPAAPLRDEAAVMRGNVAGVGWMAAAGLLFAGFMVVLKLELGHIGGIQASFLRYVAGFVFLLAILAVQHHGGLAGMAGALRPGRASIIRALLHAAGVALWFHAIMRVPMAEISALSNLGPVYATIGAALFMGERIKVRRMAAITVGFIGMLLIVKPGIVPVGSGVIAMLIATPLFSASDLIAKSMTRQFSNTVVIAQLSLFVSLALLPLAIAVWTPVTGIDLLWCGVVGVMATLGHFCFIQAFRVSEMWAAQSGKFLQLVFAAALGWAILGDVLDGWTLLGGVIIVASIAYIARRESLAARARG